MNKMTSWLWGVVLIVLGVILGVSALGIIEINLFFPGWWTLFIIVPCFISLFGKDDDKTGDLIGILIGVCLLLACQGVIRFDLLWKLIVPVALVVIGVSMIFKDALKGKVLKEVKKVQGKSGQKEYWATFSGQNLNFAGEKFTGCRLEAVFGGIKCDLREAKIEDKALVKAGATFGGVTIYVPEDVKVKVVSTSIFGGTSDKRKNINDEAEKTLYIDATSVFGGVEIR